MCASLHEGTNADLEDWLAQYRCSTRGGSSRRPHSGAHVVLYDDRRLSGVEWEAASWSLEPWVESGWLTWKHTAPEPHDTRQASTPAEDDARARGSSQHEHLHATSPSASDARRPPGQARRVACHEQLARHPGCNWMAMIEAPYESLVHGSSSEIPQRDHGSSSDIPQRDHGSSSEISQRDHGSSSEHRGASEQSRAPPVSTTSIPSPSHNKPSHNKSSQVEPDASASPSARGECPAAAGETSRSRLPGDGTMRVGVVRFGLGGSRPPRGSQLEVELPVRPLPVVSDRREATWGRCIRTDGTLCASLDETAVLIRLTRTHESTAGADDNHNRTIDPDGTLHHRTKDDSSRRRRANSAVPPLLWPPTALGALRVHRYTGRAWGGRAGGGRAWGDHSSGRGDCRGTGHVGHGGKDGRGGPSGASSHRAASHLASQSLFGFVVDPFGREAFEACLATGTPSYDRDDARSDDALAFDSWAAAASEAVAQGDGLAMFSGALSRAEASLLREDLLSAIPPAKRTTRVFANHMCQVRSPLISRGCP